MFTSVVMGTHTELQSLDFDEKPTELEDLELELY